MASNIKILFIPLLILFTCNTVSAQSDTIIINLNGSKLIFSINNPKDLEELKEYDMNKLVTQLKVKISDDSSLLHIDQDLIDDSTFIQKSVDKDFHNDNNENLTITYLNKSRNERKTKNQFNFDFGVNSYLENYSFPDESNAPYAVRPWGSWYLAINSTYITKLTERFQIEWGPGISWYNFKFQDERTLIIDNVNVTTFISDPDLSVNYKKSKLTASFLNFTAVPMFQFGEKKKPRSISDFNSWHDIKINKPQGGLRLGIGGYAGYRLGSHSKIKYKGGERDKNRDNFNLHNIRYGLRLQAGFRGTDLFFNYDLNNLFNEGYGPNLNAFSFGIII